MTYPSPAFDINGNLVTVDLEGGDYSNLPAGYYTTPGQAAVARNHGQSTGSATPITAQQVYQIYSNPDPVNQAAVQAVFNNPPPPSDYVAPTPPVEQGWVAPTPTPPPTATQIVAQMYIDNGYTPPTDAIIHAIIAGTVVAPVTDPLPTVTAPSPTVAATVMPVPPNLDIWFAPEQTADNPPAAMPAVDYATQRPDLVVNWVRAHNPNWVAANPGAGSVVQFINAFPTLTAYLSNDFGSVLAGPDPTISPDVIALVASEVPTTAVTPTVVTPVVPNVPVPTTAGSNSGSTVSPYFDPTHRSIGWDATGRENFIQIDESGNIIAYASNGANLRNLGPATRNAAEIAAALLAQNPYKTNPLLSVGGSVNAGGGGSTGSTTGQGNINGNGSPGSKSTTATNEPPGLSLFFDPTHRSIGWDVHGKENFVQIDESGNIIAYASDGTNLRNLGAATQSAAATAAALLAQNPYKTNPLNGAGTTVTTNPSTGTSADTSATSSSTSALLLLGAAAIVFFTFRKN